MRQNIRASFKMILFALAVSAYLMSALIFYPLTWISPFKARRILISIISFYSRLGLMFMGVKVVQRGEMSSTQNSFIVCNHLGYLDVLVMASKLRACFVTSLEMRQTPFLGQLCEMGGCLYVDRRSRENLSKEISMLTNAMKAGLNVCVFPEGTSTNGSEVLRFKRPLFQSALEAQVPVSVMVLNYQSVDGSAVSALNRDSLFWYGDMSFLPHLWEFFKLEQVVVELSFVSELVPSGDYTDLSIRAHELVKRHFKVIANGASPYRPTEASLPLGRQVQSDARP